MKVILIILLFLQMSFSNTNLTSEEKPVFQQNTKEQLAEDKLGDKQDKNEQIKDNPPLKEGELKVLPISKILYLSYVKFPKNIYKNQRFEIVLKALITTDKFDKIETSFVNSENMDVLNPHEPWRVVDSNSFENSYYFKASQKDFVLPTFKVSLYKNEKLIDFTYLKPKKTRYLVLGNNDTEFSNIIAKNLVVNAYKTKQYNNKQLITLLDINATFSNLEDFYLKEFSKDQGISSIKDEYPKQHILYYFIAPIYKNKLEFTYFNTTSNSFKTIKIPLDLKNELISTQTDLNPNDSSFELYKKIGLLLLLLIFLISFIWTRSYLYLILVLILIISSIIYFMPNKKLLIDKDSMVHILPTDKSTVFYELKKARIVEVLNKKDEFIKIMFYNGKQRIIGWIKEDNIGKN